MSAWGGGTEFSCRHCSACPRSPCNTAEDVAECPNASDATKRAARGSLPGYNRDAEDELEEYRRRFGPLGGKVKP